MQLFFACLVIFMYIIVSHWILSIMHSSDKVYTVSIYCKLAFETGIYNVHNLNKIHFQKVKYRCIWWHSYNYIIIFPFSEQLIVLWLNIHYNYWPISGCQIPSSFKSIHVCTSQTLTQSWKDFAVFCFWSNYD